MALNMCNNLFPAYGYIQKALSVQPMETLVNGNIDHHCSSSLSYSGSRKKAWLCRTAPEHCTHLGVVPSSSTTQC